MDAETRRGRRDRGERLGQAGADVLGSDGQPLPKVYLFSRGVVTPMGDHAMIAVAEDGEVLGEHICSDPRWGRNDLHDVAWRRPLYDGRFGEGGNGVAYQLVECDAADVPAEVHERNQAAAAAEQGDRARALDVG